MALQILNLKTGYPRRGRDRIGNYVWLGRLADKARAEHARTLDDYTVFCAVSRGFFERLGISMQVFYAPIEASHSDDQLARYLDAHTTASQRDQAAHWILVDNASDLADQDRDEGRA